jgi:hypothetical protein
LHAVTKHNRQPDQPARLQFIQGQAAQDAQRKQGQRQRGGGETQADEKNGPLTCIA